MVPCVALLVRLQAIPFSCDKKETMGELTSFDAARIGLNVPAPWLVFPDMIVVECSGDILGNWRRYVRFEVGVSWSMSGTSVAELQAIVVDHGPARPGSSGLCPSESRCPKSR